MNSTELGDEERKLMKQPGGKVAMLSTGSSPENSDDEEDDADQDERASIATEARSINGSAGNAGNDDDDDESSIASSCNYDQIDSLATRTLGESQKELEAPNNHGQLADHQQQHQQQQLQQQRAFDRHQHNQKDYEDVKQVELFGVSIVALTINGKERLCLAQISNTLLKEFSYNEIHNRRVALGITCVQCTPIQLEMLRRAGAMPSSSRRCGMITMREAERLCRSFLVEEQPPELPENFYFTVAHRVNYGCKGRFVPARYISSRAKCIECFYCGEFYSPNKFIFHYHRQPHITDCNPPDSPNINSWRKHIDLDLTQDHSQEIKYAWEDVKSLFNGGTRRRAPQSGQLTTSDDSVAGASGSAAKHQIGHRHHHHHNQQQQHGPIKQEEDQLIDVDDSSSKNFVKLVDQTNQSKPKLHHKASWGQTNSSHQTGSSRSNSASKRHHQTGNSLMLNTGPGGGVTQAHRPPSSSADATSKPHGSTQNCLGPMKRSVNSVGSSGQHHPYNKLFPTACNMIQRGANNQQHPVANVNLGGHSGSGGQAGGFQALPPRSPCSMTIIGSAARSLAGQQQQPLIPFHDFMNSPTSRCQLTNETQGSNISNQQQISTGTNKPSSLSYPNSPNFIYSQLYNQLMQQQQQNQASQPQLASTVDAQLALRQHLWTSLLANLQCNTANQTYSLQQQQLSQPKTLDSLCDPGAGGDVTELPATNINHLLAARLYQTQPNGSPVGIKLPTGPGQGSMENTGYKTNQNNPFALHKSYSGEAGDL